MNKKTKDTIKPEKDIKKTIDKVDLEEIAPEGPGEFDNVKLRRIPSRGKLTFFYKKNDGVVFAAEEQEAATESATTDETNEATESGDTTL